MASDQFDTMQDSPSSPSRAPFAVTASDTLELNPIPKALYVGTGGNVVVRGMGASADVTFRNVASGQVLDVRARLVKATGTTAADIVGLA